MLYPEMPHSGEVGAASAAEEEAPPRREAADAKKRLFQAAGAGAAVRGAAEARSLCLIN